MDSSNPCKSCARKPDVAHDALCEGFTSEAANKAAAPISTELTAPILVGKGRTFGRYVFIAIINGLGRDNVLRPTYIAFNFRY
jgi:hypothetical protein